MPHYYLPVSAQYSILNELISQVTLSIKDKPLGFLNIQHSHNCVQYYCKQKRSDLRGNYIRLEKLSFIKELAQKDYVESFLRACTTMQKELLRLEKLHAERSASFLYHALAAPFEKLSPERKSLVQPYVLPDDLFVASWLSTPYEKKPFYPGDGQIYAEKGFRVRSKSEKIMADKLDRMGIPYLYEFPLDLPPYGTIHNDLTILDIRERIAVRHEHFGRMQDPSYAYKNMQKIDRYIQAGFRPGFDFLYTLEGEHYTVDMKNFEKLIQDRFL